MTPPAHSDLKSFQRKCWLALNLYTDLAEATCAMLINSKSTPLSPSDRAKFIKLRNDESRAMAAYLQARLRLMTLLSVSACSADRGVWLALNAENYEANATPHSHV
jgi:hypothetical protein